MSCDWTEKISLLVDGELADGDARAARVHLESCDECSVARADFLLFRRQLGSYSAQTSVAAQRRALEAILSSKTPATPARVREESGAWLPRAVWRERVAGALAAPRLAPAAALLALVVLALGLFVYTTSRRETQTAREASFGTPARANATPSPATRNEAATVTGTLKEKDDESAVDNSSEKRVVENPPEKRSSLVAAGKALPNSPRVNRRRRLADSAGALQAVAVATEPSRRSPRIEPPSSTRIEPPSINGDATATAAAAPVSDRARVMPMDAGRHVEQAQLLLRSFRNARLSGDDLVYERERSRKLLYRNMFLRREAASKGEAQVEGLLDRLEPILIDIANLPDKPAKEEVASIRERMRKKNLVVSLQAAATRQRSF